jgi:hypothetical protein
VDSPAAVPGEVGLAGTINLEAIDPAHRDRGACGILHFGPLEAEPAQVPGLESFPDISGHGGIVAGRTTGSDRDTERHTPAAISPAANDRVGRGQQRIEVDSIRLATDSLTYRESGETVEGRGRRCIG